MHLILSHRISYPYFIKFHDFADNSQEGMKHKMRGATQAQTGHDFTDNSNITGPLSSGTCPLLMG